MRTNRLLRSHFRLDGQPKKSYPTSKDAWAAALQQTGMKAYQCEFCDKWHIATRPKKGK